MKNLEEMKSNKIMKGNTSWVKMNIFEGKSIKIETEIMKIKEKRKKIAEKEEKEIRNSMRDALKREKNKEESGNNVFIICTLSKT